jgi:hypothetical protein
MVEKKVRSLAIQRKNLLGGIEQNITLSDENGDTCNVYDIFMVYFSYGYL